MLGRTRRLATGERPSTTLVRPAEAVPEKGGAGSNAPARRPLFRKEVIEFQQQNRQWGRVVPLQPLSTLPPPAGR